MHLLRTVTKAPAATPTDKCPLLPKPSLTSLSKTGSRHTQVRLHPVCGSTLSVGWPATALPPPDLRQSTAASAPHTCRAAHALCACAPHHIRIHHICTTAPATHPCTKLRHEALDRRMQGARFAISDACPPRDDALRSRWLGAAFGQPDLVPLVERVGDHGRSQRRTRDRRQLNRGSCNRAVTSSCDGYNITDYGMVTTMDATTPATNHATRTASGALSFLGDIHLAVASQAATMTATSPATSAATTAAPPAATAATLPVTTPATKAASEATLDANPAATMAATALVRATTKERNYRRAQLRKNGWAS